MAPAGNLPPISLGLGGDGDEVDAIGDVERRFGVTLDYSQADGWRTVGDVFGALQQALPAETAQTSQTWPIFTQAISAETGVDPLLVTKDTLLLAQARLPPAMIVSGLCFILLMMVLTHFL